jgi:hypothetical protein
LGGLGEVVSFLTLLDAINEGFFGSGWGSR